MMSTESTIPVVLSLISLHPDHIDSLCCPSCGELMDLHQPESGLPERMLWTCHLCGTWFLMDLVPGKPEAVLVCLPDHDYFLTAMGL